MRSDIRKRLDKLEADHPVASHAAANFGACLTADEWQRVLSEFDEDPHVAFAAITSDKVPAMVKIMGCENGPAPVPESFTDLVECDDPRAHYWTARMAAWAIVYREEGFWTDQETRGFDGAVSRLLAYDGASKRVTALCEALRGSDRATETLPIIVDFIGVERRSPVAIEFVGKDALL